MYVFEIVQKFVRMYEHANRHGGMHGCTQLHTKVCMKIYVQTLLLSCQHSSRVCEATTLEWSVNVSTHCPSHSSGQST